MVQVPWHEVCLLGETGLSLDHVLGCCFQSWYQCVLGLVEAEVEVDVEAEGEVGKKPGVWTSQLIGLCH